MVFGQNGYKWKNNKLRFLDKIKHMDYSFCTTDPKALKMQNKNISFIPNPVDDLSMI